MSTTYHVAITVDIDRFTDQYLEQTYLTMFRKAGLASSVKALREVCARARSAGQRVFAPCAHTNPDGTCAGHPSTPELEETERFEPAESGEFALEEP